MFYERVSNVVVPVLPGSLADLLERCQTTPDEASYILHHVADGVRRKHSVSLFEPRAETVGPVPIKAFLNHLHAMNRDGREFVEAGLREVLTLGLAVPDRAPKGVVVQITSIYSDLDRRLVCVEFESESPKVTTTPIATSVAKYKWDPSDPVHFAGMRPA